VLAVLKEKERSYKAIKRTCRKIHTQCLRVESLRHKNAMSILTKTVVQMSAKIGNVGWCPENIGLDRLPRTILAAFDSSSASNKTVASVCLAHQTGFGHIQSGF
jgi:hypothetical protein